MSNEKDPAFISPVNLNFLTITYLGRSEGDGYANVCSKSLNNLANRRKS